MTVEWNVSCKGFGEHQLDPHASRSNLTLLAAIARRHGVWNVNDVQERRLLDALAVNLEQAEVELVDVEGVQLVGPVLDGPLLRRSGMHRDCRWRAHLERPQ